MPRPRAELGAALAGAALGLLLGAPAAGQEPAREQPAREVSPEELARIRARLADAKLPLEERASALRAFFAANAERRIPPRERMKLLVRLATFDLALRRGREAIRHFREAEKLCKASDLYVRARCRLGLGQAHELLGEESEALARYAEARRLRGTPFARIAMDAIERLRAKRRVTIGRELQLPPRTRSLRGRPVRARSEGASLLVCVPPLQKGAKLELPELLRKLPIGAPIRVVLSAPSRDARRWAAALASLRERTRVLVLRDRVDLALGIASLPSSVLLDAAGRVVEMNPTPRRLREILQR